MNSIIKRTAALLAVATVMSMCPLSIEASTLKTENGVKYIQYDNGQSVAYTGWTKNKTTGKRYYYKNGIMKKSCWLRSNGQRKYFLKKDGSMAVGKVTISGVEYEFDEKGALISDDFGVLLSSSDVTPTGLTFNLSFERPSYDCLSSLITDDGNYVSLFCGEDYTLEKYTSSGWKAVPYLVDEIGWDDIAYELNGKSEFDFSINWEYIYGSLESGNYRVCKKLNYFNDEGIIMDRSYYIYFKI